MTSETSDTELYLGYSKGELRHYDSTVRDLLRSEVEIDVLGDTLPLPDSDQDSRGLIEYDLADLGPKSDLEEIQSARGGPSIW